MPRAVGIGAGDADDAANAESGLGADRLVEALPDAQAFDDQRDLALVAAILAHPAPVAAGLLAGDVALLAQGDGDAPLGESQRRAGTDDAAADDDGARLGGRM